MSMPAQVRKQSAAVQALYEQMNTEGDKPDLNAEEVVDDKPPNQEPPVEPPVQVENFEQKYKTLQGMYNADMTRLRSEKADLEARLKAVEQKITTPPANTPPTKAKREPTVLITASDKEEFGEAIEVMRRAAQEEMENRYSETITSLQETVRLLQSQITTDIAPSVKRVSAHQAASVEDRFWNDLDTMVPDWEAINADDGFQTWLLEKDRLSGFTRQAFLEDAQRKYDSVRVSEFFNEWKLKTTPSNGSKPGSSKSDLEKQLVPGKSKSSGTGQEPKAVVYTREDVRKFYRDVASGVYKGNEPERARIETDIFAAQQSGRIVDR